MCKQLKRSIIVGMLILIVSVGLASPERTHQDLNGWDWLSWSGDRQGGFLVGWSMAMWYTTQALNAHDYQKLLELASAQSLTVREGLALMSSYYRPVSTRADPLLEALYHEGPFVGQFMDGFTRLP